MFVWDGGQGMSYEHRSKQMAMKKAYCDKFVFLYPVTSLLPSVIIYQSEKNNEGLEATGGKKKQSDFIAITLVMRTKENR